MIDEKGERRAVRPMCVNVEDTSSLMPRRSPAFLRPQIGAGVMVLQHTLQVAAVVALATSVGQALQLPRVDEALGEGDLLDASDLQALPLFQRLHEDRG